MSKQGRIFVLVGLAVLAVVGLSLWSLEVVSATVGLVPVLVFSVGVTVLVPGLRKARNP